MKWGWQQCSTTMGLYEGEGLPRRTINLIPKKKLSAWEATHLPGAQRVMNFALTQVIDLGIILRVRKYLV
jgi:hypothetical protein